MRCEGTGPRIRRLGGKLYHFLLPSLFAAKNSMETSAKAVFAVVILGIWCYFMSTLTVNMLKKQHTRAKTD